MRPKWNDYFMGLAYHASLRSHDSETKVGCVIVSENNAIIGFGYNGFCSGIHDDELPTTRPDKYPYMVHAEQNALSNVLIKPPSNCIAYITKLPCEVCSKLLWQNNIRHWRVPKNNNITVSANKDQKNVIDLLISHGLQIDYIDIDLSYLKNI